MIIDDDQFPSNDFKAEVDAKVPLAVSGQPPFLEDHPSGCKWLVTSIYKPWKGHL